MERLRFWLIALLVLATGLVEAQTLPRFEPLTTLPRYEPGTLPRFDPFGTNEPDLPQVADSGVGYIDTALIGNRWRLRYDAAFDNVKPSRAEFFWPVGQPLGPGPGPETSVDYQDASAYVEWSPHARFSVFGEAAYRFVDPELNASSDGIGDTNAGFRFALRQNACATTTFQFRGYIPSGDGSRGLGTDHYSLEPALLHYQQLAPFLSLELEVRDWFAIDGTDGFAGNVLRYGAGLSYQINRGAPPLRAVGELVGWTVLDGATAFSPAPGLAVIEDASGDTIINVKVGLRWQFNACYDLYAGYGQALTDETWYDHVARIELRRTF
jgi:hypothetical protein